MGRILFDIRTVARGLIRQPLWSLLAVLALALGIGANSAIFSLVDHVMLRDLPYRDPARLVAVHLESTGLAPAGQATLTLPWTYPLFRLFQESQTAYSAVAAYAGFMFNLAGGEAAERVPVELVSATYLPLLGVAPWRGRVFAPAEDAAPGASHAALIGYDLWRRRFGGEASAIGRAIRLDNVGLTVVGVLPPGFKGLTRNAQVWVPMSVAPELMGARRLTMRFAHWHEVVARLAPGVSRQQGDAALAAFGRTVAEKSPFPKPYGTVRFAQVPLREEGADPRLNQALWVLFAAVGLVFLIACVNALSLLLARFLGRRRETALRVALGASRGALVRLFMTESLLLGLAGGCVGLVVASWAVHLATALGPVALSPGPLEIAPPDALSIGDVHLGTRVLAVNFLFALVGGLLLGALPAAQAARLQANTFLKQETAGVGAVGRRGVWRRAGTLNLLVVVEIALSVVLLVGSGLLVQSFLRLRAERLGFDSRGVVSLAVSHPMVGGATGKARQEFYRAVLDRLRAQPGVEAASLTSRLPFAGAGETSHLTLPEQAAAPTGQVVGIHIVDADYFQTLGIPRLRGRGLNRGDVEGSPKVAVLNETAVRRVFGDRNPLGARIHLDAGWGPNELAEVVGVVGDARYQSLEDEPGAQVYVPYAQNPTSDVYLVFRATGPIAPLAQVARAAVHELDPNVPVFNLQTLDQLLGDVRSKPRFVALLLSAFAGLAFLLAAIGLYGVMSFSVTRRRGELALRAALGAGRWTLFSMVLGEVLLLAAVGVAIGLGLAVALRQVLASLVFRLTTTDPATLAGVAVLVLLLSLLAGYLPARVALGVQPNQALKHS